MFRTTENILNQEKQILKYDYKSDRKCKMRNVNMKWRKELNLMEKDKPKSREETKNKQTNKQTEKLYQYLSDVSCPDQELVHSSFFKSLFISFFSERKVLCLSFFSKHLEIHIGVCASVVFVPSLYHDAIIHFYK